MMRRLVNASGANIKSRKGTSITPDTINHNGLSATTSSEIAQIFFQFFSECFNDSDAPENPPPVYNYSSSFSHCSSSSEDIHSFHRKLNNTCTAGVDGIANLMLKGTTFTVITFSPILSDIFCLSLSTGQIPDAWKLSRVVPVFKSGDPHTASNYRPISLQLICCKRLEKVIHGFVLKFNNILTDKQFGFFFPSHLPQML